MIARVSAASPSGVDVPCALMYAGGLGLRRSHVVRVVRRAVAEHLGVHVRPPRPRALEILQHEHACALADDEPLHALWRLNSTHGARLFMEFMGLANHRKEIRSEFFGKEMENS